MHMKKWSPAAQKVNIPMPYKGTHSRKRLVAPMTGSAVHSAFWGSQYSMNNQNVDIKTETAWLKWDNFSLGTL